MRRTLYLSDLDGTLLRGDETLSPFTIRAVNELAHKGVCFSYATARSAVTAEKVTADLRLRTPAIVHNGVFIWEPQTRRRLARNRFTPGEAAEISAALQAADVLPIVYTYSGSDEEGSAEGCERFHYWSDPVHGMGELFPGLRAFLETRRGDPRETPVGRREELLPYSAENPGGLTGEIYYYTCIDRAEKLAPLYERFRDRFTCVFSPELYTGAQWLEILPCGANKASAALKLKQLLNCNRLVCFGDAVNDLPLFEVSDECYAVENAAPAVKERATGVIRANDCDGVAKWLLAHVDYA